MDQRSESTNGLRTAENQRIFEADSGTFIKVVLEDSTTEHGRNNKYSHSPFKNFFFFFGWRYLYSLLMNPGVCPHVALANGSIKLVYKKLAISLQK